MNDINLTINQNNSSDTQKDEDKQRGNSFLKMNFTEVSYLFVLILGIAISLYERNYYWSIAFLWSGFLGSFAYKIHTNKNYEDETWPRVIHQFIFNFGLALFGWFIIWFLFFYKNLELNKLDTTDLILLGVSLISLSGYLPSILSRGNPFK